MNLKFQISNPASARLAPANWSAPVPGRSDVERLSVVGKTSTIERANIAAPGDGRTPNANSIRNPQSAIRNCAAFTLIEVLVVVVLMSFIILALMAVFNGTQTAFRASLTQSDVLEGGRSAMGMIKSDLESMTPSFGRNTNQANGLRFATDGYGWSFVPVNFQVSVLASGPNTPLVQSLTGSGQSRTNVLESFFILTRQNLTWTGVGYVVDTTSHELLQPALPFFHEHERAGRRPDDAFQHFSHQSARLHRLSNFAHQLQHEPFDGRRGGFARARL